MNWITRNLWTIVPIAAAILLNGTFAVAIYLTATA